MESGSTSTVTFIGRNVIVNFCVAGCGASCWIYGFVPPIPSMVAPAFVVSDAQYRRTCWRSGSLGREQSCRRLLGSRPDRRSRHIATAFAEQSFHVARPKSGGAAYRQTPERIIPNPDSDQLEHWPVQRFAHPSDLTVLAFGNHQLEPGVLVRSPDLAHDRGAAALTATNIQAIRELEVHLVIHNSSDLDVIGFRYLRLWAEQPIAEFRVIREDQQTGGIHVQ